jgi:lipopolysaccharide export system protein LptC
MLQLLIILAIVLVGVYFNSVAKKERIQAELTQRQDDYTEKKLKKALNDYSNSIAKTIKNI